MPAHALNSNSILDNVVERESEDSDEAPSVAAPRKYDVVYPSVITIAYGHLASFYGIYLFFTSAQCETMLFAFVMHVLGTFGITAGAHRLWTHKCYKASLPLEILLMIFCSMNYQYSIIKWARDHRLHHKYSDTDADPYNASRGMFFSHMGWLVVKKHPEVHKRGKKIDISDLRNNPVLKFQKQYIVPMLMAFTFILPTLVPIYYWGETINNAWHINMLRYVLSLHIALLVNSVAHSEWGNKPYDKAILSSETKFVSILTLGEGFHNYHHTFPWDYRAAELGNNKFNMTTKVLDLFIRFGWAYDAKTASDKMILERSKRTGDGAKIWAQSVYS